MCARQDPIMGTPIGLPLHIIVHRCLLLLLLVTAKSITLIRPPPPPTPQKKTQNEKKPSSKTLSKTHLDLEYKEKQPK